MRALINQRQSSLLAAATAIFILSALVSVFAQSKSEGDRLKFEYVSSTFNQNSWLKSAAGHFDFLNQPADALFASNSHPVFEQPKPDFSAMEKWYEIVKYEYGDPATQYILYIWVKRKVQNVPIGFCMQFFDKDGVMVKPIDPRCGNAIGIPSSAIGQVTKADVYTPFETDMERVVSARVVRVRQ